MRVSHAVIDCLPVQMRMEVWTELVFVDIHCKAASMAAISSS